MVNKALAAAGYNERLVKGKDYWYFVDGDSHRWYSRSVGGVYRLNQLTVEQWIRARNELANDPHNR